MSDLISRAAVIKMLQEKAESYKPSMFDTESECSIAKIVAIEALQEVSHMEPIDATVNRYGESRITSYCPHCGAKMTGEADWLSSK